MRYTNKFVQFLGGNNTIVIASQKDFKFINDLVKKVGLDLPWKSYTELLKLAVINKCLVDKSKVIIEYQQFKGFTFGYKSYEESENWYGQTPFFVEDIKEEFEEKIQVICYNKSTIYKSRDEAIKFYNECYAMSEGAEQERYSNILYQLHSGKKVCIDTNYD